MRAALLIVAGASLALAIPRAASADPAWEPRYIAEHVSVHEELLCREWAWGHAMVEQERMLEHPARSPAWMRAIEAKESPAVRAIFDPANRVPNRYLEALGRCYRGVAFGETVYGVNDRPDR